MTGAIRVLFGIPALGFVALASTPIEPSALAPIIFVALGVAVWVISVGFRLQNTRKHDRYDRSLAQSFVGDDTSDCVLEGYSGEAA